MPLEEFDDQFKTVRATMRGRTYVLRELEADEYERCLEQSRGEDGESDNIALLKLMLAKSVVEPKMTVAQLWKLPYPVIRKLNDIINEMHFSVEETEEEKQPDEDEGEGKPLPSA